MDQEQKEKKNHQMREKKRETVTCYHFDSNAINNALSGFQK
jgi:hypothetical protein